MTRPGFDVEKGVVNGLSEECIGDDDVRVGQREFDVALADALVAHHVAFGVELASPVGDRLFHGGDDRQGFVADFDAVAAELDSTEDA